MRWPARARTALRSSRPTSPRCSAREDTVQAKAALLPNANGFSQFIYTQPNGLPSGIFVANDGPHVYNNQAIVHGDIYAPAKMADYHKSQVAEAVAHAKADIAARGLVAVVVENYYGMVSGAAQARQRAAEPDRGPAVSRHHAEAGARRGSGALRYRAGAGAAGAAPARRAGCATGARQGAARLFGPALPGLPPGLSRWWTI